MTLRICFAPLLHGLCALLLVVSPLISQPKPLDGFDAYIERALRDWSVPGLALAVIKDDSVVYERGYGVRTKGKSDPVDEQTIFAVASTTKAMTAACLGMLVDEGKLSWDDRVTKWLPEFQLSDPWTTRELTVRDLLTHRAGLERADLLWYGSSYDRREILRRIRSLRPGWSFRSRFGYQNIMFTAAGEVVAAASGMTWDDFMSKRLFAPLGMTSSSTSVRALEGRSNVATPHEEVDTIVVPVRWPNYDNLGGAGAVNASVHDMAQWARMLLAKGVYAGKRLLTEKTVEELMTPQIVERLDSTARALRPSTHFLSYGFGWNLLDYQGKKLVTHDGWLDGMRTRVMLVPEIGLGVVVILNGPRAALHGAVAYRIVDRYLGLADRDWSGEYLAMAATDRDNARKTEAKHDAERVKGTRPAFPLSAYAGTYESELYGEVTLVLEKDKLVMRFGALYVGDLTHWHYETFRVDWRDRVLGWDDVLFAQGFDGKVASLTWNGLGEFRRK